MAPRRSTAANQSTLTQMPDFLEPSSASVYISESDPERDDIGSEGPSKSRKRQRVSFHASRSRKRRDVKAGSRGKRQDTLTQNWSRLRAFGEPFIWNDTTTDGLDLEYDQDVELDANRPMEVNATDDESDSPISIHTFKQAINSSVAQENTSTRPSSADVVSPCLHTPHRPRTREVPSSQTPPSIRLSNCSPEMVKLLTRSPLHLRSLRSPRKPPTQLLAPNSTGTLQHQTTVEDSQSLTDPLGLGQPAVESSAKSMDLVVNHDEDDYHTYDHDDIIVHDSEDDDPGEYYDCPETYDPANSALERDAYRFLNGKTQFTIPEMSNYSKATTQDEKTLQITSGTDHMGGRDHGLNRNAPIDRTRAITDVERSNTASIIQPLMLSMPFHDYTVPSSQVSQTSPIGLDDSQPLWRTRTMATQIFSSSPFPLPPGAAHRSQYSDAYGSGADTMDLSLPPPPPMLTMLSSE